jgi:transposase-like protein
MGKTVNHKGPNRCLTSDEEVGAITRYQLGESARQIAISLEVHPQTIHNTLKRYGIPTRPDAEKKRLTDAQKTAIVAACRAGGENVGHIARRFNTSESSITRVLREFRAAYDEAPSAIYVDEADAAELPEEEEDAMQP